MLTIKVYYKKNGSEKSRKLSKHCINLSIENYRNMSWRLTQATAVEYWPLSTPTKRTCKNRLPDEKRATGSLVKCAGCSTKKGDINLCINCFKDFHKDHQNNFRLLRSTGSIAGGV